MSKRALFLLIILLLLILVAEAVAIYRFPTTGEPLPPSGSSTTNTTQNTTPDTSTDKTNTTNEPDEPSDRPDLFATQTYDVVNTNELAGDTIRWTETWEVVSNEPTIGATEKEIRVTVTSTREDDIPTTMVYTVYKDGRITATNWMANTPEGQLDCTADLPMYLPSGVDSATASMSCVAGGLPIFTFNGQAVAQNTTALFNGKDYPAREITITTGSVAAPAGQSLPAAFSNTFAPGLGAVQFNGSIGDVIIGKLTGALGTEAQGTLSSSSSDSIWAF